MSFYKQGLSVGADRWDGQRWIKEPDTQSKKGDGVLTFIILGVLGILIFGLSPGARHFYRHGKLPPG